MSDRLTAEPGTLEFLRQLLEIAQESDHPMDKALARVLSRQIGERRSNAEGDVAIAGILHKKLGETTG
jgi:hypothetical protein